LKVSGEGKLDPAVVSAFYDKHGEQLRRFLVGLLRDSQLANDVLQATFAKFIERGHESHEESRKSWLFRVAYNEAMLVRRRQAVGDKIARRAAWHREYCTDAADEPLVRLEVVERVRELLAELPDEQAKIVRLRIYEEKTFAAIAEQLGIPLGTALGRMRAAMQKLRKALETEDWHIE
jgi:RNA polymerase sigma-70 factor (ECF subfamily)